MVNINNNNKQNNCIFYNGLICANFKLYQSTF